MNEKLQKLVIRPEDPISRALERIDAGGEGIALVADASGVLRGTVTDGDIRRAILRATPMSEPVSRVMNANPVTVQAGVSAKYLENLMKSRSIRHVPVVDDELLLVDIVLMRELMGDRAPAAARPITAVIMAGGLGTRLHAVTRDEIPKPLVKVGGKPVLENIIDRLGAQGLDRIYISVHHKKEQIEDYFKDGSGFNVHIDYLEEKKRLGTAGALGYLRGRVRDPFVVMNADLVCDIKFQPLVDYHAQAGNQITVCSRRYEMEVPFGVLRVDGEAVQGIEEKPKREFFVNAGIYILEPAVLDLIPDQTYLDMTDLIQRALAAKMAVGTFPILSYWIDIGKAEDYERANRDTQQPKACVSL